MNFPELRDHVYDGGYLMPLYSQVSNTSSGSKVEQLLEFVRPPLKDEVRKRYQEIATIMNPIIGCIYGQNLHWRKTHERLQKFMRGQKPRRVFLAGGCASYVLGR